MKNTLAEFQRLVEIMDELRAKCPWDKEQTFESLRYLTIEETYELSDSIVEGQFQELKKELGDLLLHVVFYAKIASEQQLFDISEVLYNINEKLVRRHPHIFGDVVVENAEQVKENWEKIKLKEHKKSVLSGVPKSLPAMVKAIRIQEKARGVGFDWENATQVWDKVLEELNELQTEIQQQQPKDKIESEFGDVIFALVNYARFIGINPEDALEKTNKKFIERFTYIEEQCKLIGKTIDSMTLAEMDAIWNRAKIDKK